MSKLHNLVNFTKKDESLLLFSLLFAGVMQALKSETEDITLIEHEILVRVSGKELLAQIQAP